MNHGRNILKVALELEELLEHQRDDIKDWMEKKAKLPDSRTTVSDVFFRYLSESKNENEAALAVIGQLSEMTGVALDSVLN
ncbi:hypothetical protein [Agaribacterium haliotis]|uniref:hypothetical protein n=1 Tax=Agaribacterium haliotis TaxID=2013869 RepID=UPI000BB591E8|nr:hypothetical protein [Agaribacterium haliotis]